MMASMFTYPCLSFSFPHHHQEGHQKEANEDMM